jgi:hypothetical protein
MSNEFTIYVNDKPTDFTHIDDAISYFELSLKNCDDVAFYGNGVLCANNDFNFFKDPDGNYMKRKS